MKYILTLIISFSFLGASFGEVENLIPENSESILVAQKSVKRKLARTKRVKSSSLSATSSWGSVSRLIKAGNYEKASLLLYKMSLSSKYRKHKSKVTYLLGLSLFKMKMYQTSAFQFIRVVNAGNRKYVNKALEKLSIAADYLGDEAMLNYAIGKINIKRFPKAHRDMLYNRIGEFQVRSKQYRQAIKTLSRVKPSSRT